MKRKPDWFARMVAFIGVGVASDISIHAWLMLTAALVCLIAYIKTLEPLRSSPEDR